MTITVYFRGVPLGTEVFVGLRVVLEVSLPSHFQDQRHSFEPVPWYMPVLLAIELCEAPVRSAVE